MAPALLLALGSITLGAALGLARDEWGRAVHALHVTAVVAAALVSLGQLLPDAWAGAGLAGVALFAFAALAPSAAHAVTRRPKRSPDRLGLELGYVALAVHSVGDGLALRAYGAVDGSYAVAGAIALHAIPVTALIVMLFADRLGPGAGALRALGLAAAVVAGIAAGELVPEILTGAARPWIDAAVGGLLLHVVVQGRHVHAS